MQRATATSTWKICKPLSLSFEDVDMSFAPKIILLQVEVVFDSIIKENTTIFEFCLFRYIV